MIRTLLLVVALAAVPAAAQSKLDDARTHFKRGSDLYDEGNFRGALIEFQRAYELAPNYKLLYNMAQVYLALQDYAQAVRTFQRYLTEGGSELAAGRREEVQKEIERLSSRVGQVVVETTAGAEVLLDDESVGFAPLPGPLQVNVGRHRVTVTFEGKQASRAIDIAGLQTLQVVVPLERAPAPAPAVTASAESKKGGISGGAIGMWVATGVLGIGAGTMAAVAFTTSQNLQKLRDTFPVTKEQLDAQANSLRTFSIVADVLTAAAVVAGGVALYLTLSSAGSSEEAPKVALGFGVGNIALSGRF